ncbi:MAG: histidine kinase N-terminal 7TM domain-containing protein [Caldilineaceae bacterium]
MTGWHPNPYAIFLLLAALCGVIAMAFTLRRHTTIGVAVSVLLLGMVFWAAGFGAALGVYDLPSRIFWVKVQYVGISLLTVAASVFALRYIGLTRYLSPRTVLLLSVVPALGVLLAWTNEWHSLIWTAAKLQIVDGLSLLAYDYGPFFYFYAAWSYGVVAFTALIFLYVALRVHGTQRRQALFVFGGALIPCVAILAYRSGFSPIALLDLTPFGYAAGTLIVAYGLLRYTIFDIVPVARTLVLEGMTDAVLVLDARDRVLDANPAATRLMAHLNDNVVAAPGTTVPQALLDHIPANGDGIWDVDTGDGARRFVVNVSPLQTRAGDIAGRVIVFSDVTELVSTVVPDVTAHVNTTFPLPMGDVDGVAGGDVGDDALTEQQQRVLELVASGMVYKEVAAALSISEPTVKYHMGNILERLHVKNRAQAIAVARQQGLLAPRASR